MIFSQRWPPRKGLRAGSGGGPRRSTRERAPCPLCPYARRRPGGQAAAPPLTRTRPDRPGHAAASPVGFQNSATGPGPGLLCSPLVLVDEAAENGPALDALPGQVRDRVIWPGRAQVAAAMGTSSLVVGLVLAQDRLQMPLSGRACDRAAALGRPAAPPPARRGR